MEFFKEVLELLFKFEVGLLVECLDDEFVKINVFVDVYFVCGEFVVWKFKWYFVVECVYDLDIDVFLKFLFVVCFFELGGEFCCGYCRWGLIYIVSVLWDEIYVGWFVGKM